MAKGKL